MVPPMVHALKPCAKPCRLRSSVSLTRCTLSCDALLSHPVRFCHDPAREQNESERKNARTREVRTAPRARGPAGGCGARAPSRLPGSSTAGLLVTATKRSIVDNATSGNAPPPRAWSIHTGQCSITRPPPGAVLLPRQRDHEAARSNRRDALISVPVTSQWCAQDGAGQPARTAWPPRRHPSRGSS